MNIQQKQSAVLSALKWIIATFGVDLIRWALAKLESDGEVEPAANPCPNGYTLVNGVCVKDPG